MKLTHEERVRQMIIRPVTDDGEVGYDESGQFCHAELMDHGSTRFTHIHDVRDDVCIICNHGWEPTGRSMGDQTRWDLVNGYVHASCMDRHIGLNERSRFSSALCDAKIRFKVLKAIPNGYWNDPKKRPWYSIELLDFPVKLTIGKRKNVVSIELVAQGGTKFMDYDRAERSFEDEKVTKWFDATKMGVHAWTAEKEREYLGKFAEYLSATKGTL